MFSKMPKMWCSFLCICTFQLSPNLIQVTKDRFASTRQGITVKEQSHIQFPDSKVGILSRTFSTLGWHTPAFLGNTRNNRKILKVLLHTSISIITSQMEALL